MADREFRPEDAQALFDAMAEALRPVFEQFSRVLQQVHDALGGEEGIRAILAAHEEAQVEMARWEAEHPGVRFGDMCHCLCQRWAPHECAVHAETVVGMTLQGEPVPVPMCAPCAASVQLERSVR